MPEISLCLWFDSDAEEAANFYCSVFKNAKIIRVSHYPPSAKGNPVNREPGSVMTVEFEIGNMKLTALNAGPAFKFNEALSIMVAVDTQAELDEIWKKMSANPKAEQCGWLKDKFGVSWQIFPKMLMDLHHDPDPAKADRVFKKMLEMKKFNIDELKKAAA